MTEFEAINSLVRYGQAFCCRRYLVVPNASHGFGLDYEADLIAVSRSGYATEVEVKVSKHDLLKDQHKEKWKRGLDKRIKRFYYAVPDELVDIAMKLELRWENGLFPGVVRVWRRNRGHDPHWLRSEIVRQAPDLPNHVKCTSEDVIRLHHLLSVRYWDLRLSGDKEVDLAGVEPASAIPLDESATSVSGLGPAT
jgi:hypothetical protein